jgi:hypothetical protein
MQVYGKSVSAKPQKKLGVKLFKNIDEEGYRIRDSMLLSLRKLALRRKSAAVLLSPLSSWI